MSGETKTYWKGLEELHNDPEFLEQRSREFAEDLPLPVFFTKEDIEGTTGRGGVTPPLQSTRRDFLRLMGFSFAGTALAACTRMPVEKAIPYLIKPDEVTPGVANWYATTCAGCTASCPILVKSRDGRPIKVEGNPQSTLTGGGVCAVGQATVLSLYDGARLKSPLIDGKEATWEAVDQKVGTSLTEFGAGGKIVLLTGTVVSPTMRSLIAQWLAHYPGSRHVAYDPVSSSAIVTAQEKSFGVRVLPHYRFDRAKVVVGFNCDFLGTWISPVEFASRYAAGRRPASGTFLRHVQFESGMSLTGTNADFRVPIAPSEEIAIAAGLLSEISKIAGGWSDGDFLLQMGAIGGERDLPRFKRASGFASASESPTGPIRKMIQETARELWENRGASLVISGTNDVGVQTIVNAINSLLGNIGKTIDLDNPSFQKGGDEGKMERLVDEMNRGEVKALLMMGVNPAYDYPEAARFAEGLAKVSLSVSLSDRQDETAALAGVVAPVHHFLESWNDAQPIANEYSLTQPLIQPLFHTRQAGESLLKWMGSVFGGEDYYTHLRNYWRDNLFAKQSRHSDFDGFWDQVVHDGVFSVPETTPQERKFVGGIGEVGVNRNTSDNQFELHLYEKVGLRDGRHANNPWLQELPDPVTKITWDNYASLAPSTARSLGVEAGDVVRLRGKTAAIELPIQIQPGQSPQAVAVAVGYGRSRCGKVGEKVGVNAYPLVGRRDGLFVYTGVGVTLEKTGRKGTLAATQTHHSLEGRPIVKETVLSDYLKNPAAGNEEHEKLVSLWAEKKKEGHAWGMSIDLTACNGCSACLVSCQAENNVAVVGKDEVFRRREMHWIRIDRYYGGSEENPETVHQPMTCQHCGHAPCETVCPVLATVHSSDGINQQVYNRCVGTRYCENNCPYKVRRFNWFEYAHNSKFDYTFNSSLSAMVLNPDVGVRSRGVMEKCSLCIQRIQEGKLQAKREGRPLKDGEIKVACEQSCPTQAIVFGDLNDPESRVSKLNQDGRFYHVLEELNVRPVVGYLTKVRNKSG